MKLNKNGIPILDDPKTNHLPKHKCLPDEHIWKKTEESISNECESWDYENHVTLYKHTCRNCGEVDWG